MWRNNEMQVFTEWLRNHNAGIETMAERVGFHGLDLYSMGASLKAVIDYLDVVDKNAATLARRRYGCLEPWIEDPTTYGLAALQIDLSECEKQAVDMLRDLLRKRLEYVGHVHDGEEFHSAEQNAALVADAEAYYRAMFYHSTSSWNLRDTHMFETLERLIASYKHKGLAAKVVVWAHNSHLGDARLTSMGWKRGELNVGQLCRERLGQENVGIIGMLTHAGTVAASSEWDADMDVMKINPSRDDSYEYAAFETDIDRFRIDMRPASRDRHDSASGEARGMNADDRKALSKPLLERFIGVIYRPETERLSHYSNVNLSKQMDAMVWFAFTNAVKPLIKHEPATPLAFDETYPFGL